ncbi:MAG: ABC transporter substrate-binding protein [Betaproteobacteria bacterium]|nr:ABC transporter substrate-binding protein [Betaproteobacteria bacterium]
MKRLQQLLTLISAALLLCLAGPVSAQVLKLGAVLSLTGGASFIGEDQRSTLELMTEQLNARGGINGRKVETIIYDDASDPTKAVAALRRLHEQDNVVAVIGGGISGNVLAMMPFTEKARVPQLAPAASGKISQPPKEWVFQYCNTDVQSISLALQFLKARNVSKIAMLADSTGYGVSGKEELERQAAPGKGFDVVAWETFGPADSDMTAQLARIKASGARAVIVWNATPASAIIVKNARQIGLDAVQIHSTAFQSQRMIQLSGEAIEGVFITGYKLPVVDQLPNTDPQKKVILEYRDSFQKKFNKAPSAFGALVYDAFSSVTAIMAKVGDDKEKIRAGLENLKGHLGAAGIYTTSPTDHNGFLVDSMRMLVVEKAAFKLAPR